MKSHWLEPILFHDGGCTTELYTGRARGDARIWQFIIQQIRDDYYSFRIYAEINSTYKLHFAKHCNKKQIEEIKRTVLGLRVGDIRQQDIDNALMGGLL